MYVNIYMRIKRCNLNSYGKANSSPRAKIRSTNWSMLSSPTSTNSGSNMAKRVHDIELKFIASLKDYEAKLAEMPGMTEKQVKKASNRFL